MKVKEKLMMELDGLKENGPVNGYLKLLQNIKMITE